MAKQDDRDSGTPDGEGGTSTRDPSQGTEPIPAPKPSQAEGDRDTIDQDLRDKEAEGQI